MTSYRFSYYPQKDYHNLIDYKVVCLIHQVIATTKGADSIGAVCFEHDGLLCMVSSSEILINYIEEIRGGVWFSVQSPEALPLVYSKDLCVCCNRQTNLCGCSWRKDPIWLNFVRPGLKSFTSRWQDFVIRYLESMLKYGNEQYFTSVYLHDVVMPDLLWHGVKPKSGVELPKALWQDILTCYLASK